MSTRSGDVLDPKTKAAWNVPLMNVQDRLTNGQAAISLSSGKIVQPEDLKYTIIDDEKVVFRNVHELAELYQAKKVTNTSPNLIDLVSFRPERIALQQAIASVIARVQLTPRSTEEDLSLEHDHLLQRAIREVHTSLNSEQETKDAIKALYEKRETIEQTISALVSGSEVQPVSEELLTACQEAIQSSSTINEEKLGENVEGYDRSKAIIALATDIVYKKTANELMYRLVNSHIDKLAQDRELNLFDTPLPQDRTLFMLAGGQASGKGGACAQLRYSAEQGGVPWVNISKGGGDNFKKLLEPEGVVQELSDQLTANEASYINWNLVKNMLIEKVDSSKAPHIYSEQVMVSDDMLKLALMKGGQAKVIIVSTKVEDAVERAYKRGEQIGRFVPTQGILTAHKNSTVTLPECLAKVAGEKVEMLFLDNNVPKGQQPIKIATIDSATKQINILDEGKFKEFIKKSAINVTAKKLEDLYDGDKVAALSIDDYFKPCTEKQYTITIKPPEASHRLDSSSTSAPISSSNTQDQIQKQKEMKKQLSTMKEDYEKVPDKGNDKQDPDAADPSTLKY